MNPRTAARLARSRTLPALLVAAALAGCGVGEAHIDAVEAPLAGPALPVDSAPVSVTDLYASYQATSTVTADGEAQVPARAAGQVVEILVEEGDRVVQGQLLARVDGERGRLELKATAAELARLQNEQERMAELLDRGIVSQAAYDDLRFELDALVAAWELDRLELEYTAIRAPISGIVASREIRLGQQLERGDLAFRLSDPVTLLAELRVPQTELHKFAADQPARLQVAAAGNEMFAGHVERISPTIDPDTGTFRATVRIDNSAGELAPGMFARIDVLYERHAGALALPAAAVVEEDGRHVVYVIDNGVVVRREVVVGIRSGGTVEIVDGVNAGERVAISGTGGLRDGTQVVAIQPRPMTAGG